MDFVELLRKVGYASIVAATDGLVETDQGQGNVCDGGAIDMVGPTEGSFVIRFKHSTTEYRFNSLGRITSHQGLSLFIPAWALAEALRRS